MKNNNKPDSNSHLADMSLPPDLRGRKARKSRRTTPRVVQGVPAQMEHGHSPKAGKHRRDMEKKQRRQKKKNQAYDPGAERYEAALPASALATGIPAKKGTIPDD